MKKKILIVDDEVINRKLLVGMLRSRKDIEVLEADNGSMAIDIIKSNPDIKLVLLDVVMPIMNGVEFLKKRLSDNDLLNIPVIVLTTDDSKKGEVVNLAIQGFYVKPFDMVTLLEDIDKYVNK